MNHSMLTGMAMNLLSDILGTEDDVCYKDLENEVEMKALKAIGNLSERERIIVDLDMVLVIKMERKRHKRSLICLEYRSHIYQDLKRRL